MSKKQEEYEETKDKQTININRHDNMKVFKKHQRTEETSQYLLTQENFVTVNLIVMFNTM
jgi:hypothetical protein